jgi:hypothetical protein
MGEEDAREPDGQVVVAARLSERPHQERREEDEEGCDPAEDEASARRASMRRATPLPLTTLEDR